MYHPLHLFNFKMQVIYRLFNLFSDPEGRHSREGSGCSNRGSTGSHSRQNSRDKGNHSRQNSRELLVNTMPTPSPTAKTLPREPSIMTIERPPQKNIEIYATLPKSKKGLLSRATKTKTAVEDEEYLMYDRPGRSLSRTKLTGKKDEKEKRARSEERNNKTTKDKEFQSNSLTKDSKKQAKVEEPKQNKKQHKIRRKLLMGGLIRRKNRSMPDLREDETAPKGVVKDEPKTVSKDDSSVGSKLDKQLGLSGYLSEGHLEFSGNPNLERSKLMRKSLYGSKILQMAKVPPPPPLRTTSQLSKTDRPPFPLPSNDIKQNMINERNDEWGREHQSLPYIPPNYNETKKIEAVTYANGGYLLQGNQPPTRVVTTAQVHQEQSPQQQPRDEVDSGVPCDINGFPLPPYPSPLHSVSHSRQPSEDFPPPPPEVGSHEVDAPVRPPSPASLLAQVQQKRLQILSENEAKAASAAETYEAARAVGGETWLRELQAKQAALKGKNGYTQNGKSESPVTVSRISPQTKAIESVQHYETRDKLTPTLHHEPTSNNQQVTSVKDLKSRFEKSKAEKEIELTQQYNFSKPSRASPLITDNSLMYDAQVNNNTIINSLTYDASYITAHMNGLNLSHEMNKCHDNDITFANGNPVPSKQHFDNHEPRRKSGKKKNVTFCEQVVLVATADEDEVDSYIPNPILERVLRSVLHKDSPQEVRETTIQSVIPLKRTDSGNYGQRNQHVQPEPRQNVPSLNGIDTCNLQNSGLPSPNTATPAIPSPGLPSPGLATENFTYQNNTLPNVSTATNDTRHQYLSNNNGESSHQDHSSNIQRQYSSQQLTSVKSVQQSPIMSRPMINQAPAAKLNGPIQSSNNSLPHSAMTYGSQHIHSPPTQSYQQQPQHHQPQVHLQHPPLSQSYSSHSSQQPLYSPQTSPALNSSSYSYPPTSQMNQNGLNGSESQYPQTSGNNDTYQVSHQQAYHPSVVNSSPYQPVPVSQNHGVMSSPYQHVPQLQNHQYQRTPTSVAPSPNQVHGYTQQSPMMSRQLSHQQVTNTHSLDGRKLNPSNPTNVQPRINENAMQPNHSQADRYMHLPQSVYNQASGNGSLRSQHTSNDPNSRLLNNPPVHQHTTVRARPQAMYQHDLPPPEYQHPPPPRKDGSTSSLPTRSEIYQRVPNPAGTMSEVHHAPLQSNGPQGNGYNHLPSSNHGPLPPTGQSQASSSNGHPVYQYPPHHPYPQSSSQSVYHPVQHLSQPQPQNHHPQVNNHYPHVNNHHPQINHHPQQPTYNQLPQPTNHAQPPQQNQPLNHQQLNNHSQQPNVQFQQSNHQLTHNPNQYPNNQYNNNATPTPARHPVYQPPPHPKQMEAASKAPERTIQPSGVPSVRTNPCNLCRKKQVQHPSIYCADCDFYMSRFKPKT